jgi:hypothetical protein
LRDAEIQAAIKIDKSFAAPDELAEVVARDDLAGALDEAREDLSRLRLQADEDAFAAELEGGRVKFVKAEAEFRGQRMLL